MKEKELREKAKCLHCGQGIGHDRNITFYRVSIEHYLLNTGAMQRQSGLEMMLGGHVALAQIFSPNEDMAAKASGVEFTLCQDCALLQQQPIGVWIEQAAKEDDDEQVDEGD